MTRVRLLAVDLDGTLVDSAPDLAHCVDRALASVGLAPAGEAKVRGWIGDGIERLLDRALSDAIDANAGDDLLHEALEFFDVCYRENLFVRSRLYAGVRETLRFFLEDGVHLCCITNKRSRFAEALLEKAGLSDCFQWVLGGDSLADKKPAPTQLLAAAEQFGVPADEAVMVGDSHHDFHAANAAGFAFIWARYGYCPAIESSREPISISTFEELRQAIEAIPSD